ncbi:MAG: DUF1232 domain-containing protein [Alphaproteobacteria bacterium]|nr:DUF1232 domain-containing protein [Alphaproteobacteria bacterium]
MPDESTSARTVREGFWPKVKATIGKVPFLDEALAAYYCTRDPAMPAYVRAVLLGALAYFIMPIDAIPDFLAVVGFTDDASILLGALALVRRHVTAGHRAQAKEKVRALAG